MEIKCLLYVLLISSVATARRIKTIFDRVDTLEILKEAPVEGVNFYIVPSNNSLFHGEITFLRDIVARKLKIVCTVTRCLVREAPDTCEYLINLKPPNACMFFNAENMAWSAFTDAFSPKLRCPLQKGKYASDNASFDGNKWNIFALEKYFFKVDFKLFEGDLLLLDIIIEAHVVPVY